MDTYVNMGTKAGSITRDSSEKITLLNGRGGKGFSTPPRDICYATYFILYIHGVGHLLPWNFFITANHYFEVKFTCHDIPGQSNSSCSQSIANDFENYFSVSAMLPVALMTAVNIWLQSKIHYKYRLITSLVFMMLLFAVTIAFIYINTSTWTIGFFSVTLLTIVVLNVFSAIFQSSTFGFAGVLPPMYTGCVMIGQACAGVFAALALLLTTAVTKDEAKETAMGYFLTALIVVVVCLLTSFLLLRMKFVGYFLNKTSVLVQIAKEKAIKQHSSNVKIHEVSLPFRKIFLQVIVYAVSVFLVFAVTLSLFPAVVAHIKSSSPQPKSSQWTSTYFIPLMCFLIFNAGDFAGRFITQWIQIGSHRYVLLLCSVLRTLFIPLFLLCNYDKDNAIPVVFNNDAYPVIFVSLFGLSNGYISTMAMMSAPRSLPSNMRETASTIMVFFISSGLLFGSIISFVWTKVVLQI